MKKNILTFLFFFSLHSIFAENISIDTSYFFNIYDSKETCVYVVKDNHLFTFMFHRYGFDITSGINLSEYKKISLRIENHFYRNSNSQRPRSVFYLITGKGIILPIEFFYIWDEKNKCFSDSTSVLLENPMLKDIHNLLSYDYNEWKNYKDNLQFQSSSVTNFGRVGIFDTGIRKITSSSNLQENTKKGHIEYTPNNFLEKLYYIHQDELFCHVKYDSLTPPWVEGKDDYGIGEYLDIEFKWPADEMQILNGFVDFTRMDLYEKNSRVKTVLIESENPKFSKEYKLEDFAKYSLINLPQKTDKIRMTIKDVYPGTKYKDTCLSSILVTNPNVPSYEEMSTKILNAIEAGVYDRRYDKSEPLPDFIKVIEEEKPKKSNKIKKILGR